MYKKLLYIIYFILFSLAAAQTTDSLKSNSELFEKLNSLPGIEVIKLKSDSRFTEAYEIHLLQPVDHLNKINGPKFYQQMFLYHVDFSKPMVIETDGYFVNAGRHTEIASILGCNELVVEHRYFGESKPDTMDYRYLTVAQAAADHHRIVKLFKMIYKKQWISSGISKGGQTALCFKYFYPDDVNATIAYVAPLNFAQEEPRIHQFLKTVGTKECRDKITKFQRTVLRERDKIIPLLKEYAKTKSYSFSMGIDKTFEYEVLEYSFAFWQWGNGSCEQIPGEDASADILFKHLVKISPLKYLDDSTMKSISSFFYQAYTEMGYYNYETAPFRDLLQSVTGEYATNAIFVPSGEHVHFYPLTMRNINKYLQTDADNILYIYGGNDTWYASGVDIKRNDKCLKIVKKGGSHRTRIKDLSSKDKELIYSTLENWLNFKIDKK